MRAMATGVPPVSVDLLDLLEAAHARIETHLALLERLAERIAQHGSDGDARHAARFVMRFFDTTGVQHQRDEDQKLFPLLREKAAELDRPEVSAVMNEVQADHATLDLQWSRIRHWLQAVTLGDAAAPAPPDIASFVWLQRSHMAKEAALILPFARESLAPSRG